jgi:hypothetical protein
MWHSLVGPLAYRVIFIHQHSTTSPSYHFHINVQMLILPATSHLPHHRIVDTWHLFIGLHGCLKMPKMSNTWQPLVMPHHPVDVSMMSSYHLYEMYGKDTWKLVGMPHGTLALIFP